MSHSLRSRAIKAAWALLLAIFFSSSIETRVPSRQREHIQGGADSLRKAADGQTQIVAQPERPAFSLSASAGHGLAPSSSHPDVASAANVKEGETPAGLVSGDWAQMLRHIRDSEYEVSRGTGSETNGRLQAPNRKNDFRTFFEKDAVRIVPRRSGGESWEATFRLTAIGTPAAMRPVAGVLSEPEVLGNRVEYRREAVTEWWVNRASGLEHGFTLARPPEEDADRVRLEITVGGGFRAEEGEDGAVTLRKDGCELRYSDLVVRDAEGVALTSGMRGAEDHIEIVADVSGATWPVTVDPTLTQVAKLTASDGAADDWFGYSVATSGDIAVVGARFDDVKANADQGSAYVFVRSAGAWSAPQKLTASDGAASDAFGFSVAISGDTVIVGAYLDDVGANLNQGSAYVFVRSAGVWSEQQKLTASDATSGSLFGYSVVVSGDTAIVGARQGISAYVFMNSAGVWSEQQKLTGSAGGEFGTSVAVSGDTAIIGAIGGFTNPGSAYVFVRSAGVWSEQQKLAPSDGAAGDYFGWSVAVSGETAVVGAVGADVGANIEQGSAYVFVRSAGVWTEQQKLTASDGGAFGDFGISVAMTGNTAVVGAPGANANQGAAYVFVSNAGVWTEQEKLTASDATGDPDHFGISVAVSADTAVVGAYLDDVGATANQGSAYVFVRSAELWSEQQKLTAADGTDGDTFGSSVAVSGDTVVVGAPLDDGGANGDQGSAYVFLRSLGGWRPQQKLTASDGSDGDLFGAAVAIAGDTAVIGAPGSDVGANFVQGSAYVFVRNAGLWTEQQKLTAADGTAGDTFGYSVALSGDTVVVGAPDDTAGAIQQGSAYVFVRSSGVWNEQQRLTASDGETNDHFGFSASISGNTAIIGAYSDDVGANVGQGSAYVFVRDAGLWSEQQKLTAPDGAFGDRFGVSVGCSGDTAVVGADFNDVGGAFNQGSAYVFVRSAGAWSLQQKLTASDGAELDNFGLAVAVAGDTGVVGAPLDDVGAELDQGSAHVFVRSGTTWTEEQVLTAPDGAANDHFGIAVAVSEGRVVIGAHDDDVGTHINQGSAYAFTPLVDATATKSDHQTTVVAGSVTTYTIVASNAGSVALIGATLTDAFPPAITSVSWTCTASAGSSCGAPSGTGNINETVDLAVGGTVIFTASALLSAAATGTVSNTATVATPGGVVDPVPWNNSATDEDTIVPVAFVTATKSVAGTFEAGGAISYSVVLTNVGGATQGNNSGDECTDTLPAELSLVSANATSGTVATAGNTVTWNGSLASGATVTITIDASINAGTEGTVISNQGTVLFDADANGTNEATAFTDDPGQPGLFNPTVLFVGSGPVDYFTLTPCRILDTRDPNGPLGGPALIAQMDRTFAVAGNCGIPATAKAISVNLAVAQPTAAGNLRLRPGGMPVPQVSAINYSAGQTRSNNAVVPLNTSGEFTVFCGQASGTVHFILDVNGYFD